MERRGRYSPVCRIAGEGEMHAGFFKTYRAKMGQV